MGIFETENNIWNISNNLEYIWDSKDTQPLLTPGDDPTSECVSSIRVQNKSAGNVTNSGLAFVFLIAYLFIFCKKQLVSIDNKLLLVLILFYT